MNSGSKVPQAPRNHFPVAIAGVRRDGKAQPHDRLVSDRLLTGALELELEVLSPLHVGSGAYGLIADRVIKEVVYRRGEPVVPGTSIKGVCRLTHEALTRSGSPFDERCPPWSRSAVLFGALGLPGRISFDDAVPTSPVALAEVQLSTPYPPQKVKGQKKDQKKSRQEKDQEELVRRFYGPLPAGVRQPPRIPARAIPAGTRLLTALRCCNVAPAELGSVLLSLGMGGERFTPKLGGGKYDRFGWVRFSVRRYRLRAGLSFAEEPWVADPAAVGAFTADLLRHAASQVDVEALRELTAKLQAPAAETAGAR